MAKINDTVPGPVPIKIGADFKLTRFIRNRKVVWYGPHECNNCGATIVKSSHNQGGIELDAPFDHHYPNHRWVLHRCNKPEVPQAAKTVAKSLQCAAKK